MSEQTDSEKMRAYLDIKAANDLNHSQDEIATVRFRGKHTLRLASPGDRASGPKTLSPTAGQLEEYISQHDISRDDILTPNLVLLVGGGGNALIEVLENLYVIDETTGSSIPCLVLKDSGGAAEDIWNAHQHASLYGLDALR
jgi:hypothetical protein